MERLKAYLTRPLSSLRLSVKKSQTCPKRGQAARKVISCDNFWVTHVSFPAKKRLVMQNATIVGKSDDGGQEISSVKTLKKALELLRIIGASEQPLPIAAAARASGISRPTAYRLVQTLVAEGLVQQNAASGTLSVGPAVLPLAASHLDANRLRVEALPHLNALAQSIGERVNLGILYREQILYLAGVEKPSMPMIYSRFGKTAPLHCCSMGKVILANLNREIANSLLPDSLDRQTDQTITKKDDLWIDFDETLKRGYAIDKEEHLRGTFCVAVAVFDSARNPIAAVSVSGRDLQPIINKVDLIIHAAEVISHYM
jgi:IclR family transcriptional regulator, KDG regulon repressor